MEEDFLDDILGTNSIPGSKEEAKPIENKPNAGFKPKNNNQDLWSDTNIGKLKPDPSTFNKKGKSFLVILGGTPDEAAKEKLPKIVSTLGTKNFNMRYQYTDTISFMKTLADIEGLTVESYLPWKKMAPDLENPTRVFATKKAYEIASYFAPKFNNFPAAVRCIRANIIHAILGEKLDNPIDLVVCWTECGTEKITRETDFKKIGNLGSVFSPCSELNIPIYNIKNETSLKNLIEYIKSL